MQSRGALGLERKGAGEIPRGSGPLLEEIAEGEIIHHLRGLN